MSDNKGIGFVELIVIVVIIGTITALWLRTVKAEPIKMNFTCYCPESCPGTITASGETVREGIIAASKDHLGDGAIIYTTDGKFIGYFEALDTGGSPGIKNGTSVDAWMPNLTKAKEMMALTGGKVLVEWVENPKG